ncbi:baseplate J/gp47 family protein [Xanthobacteraceae bacterium Astr-EGSB]|uniref:baseplate J/gp47 family protein n=1 Tax=Astrobacterium formosum TaxID=3069710 RepID=UPI0027B7EEB1|nr:baseplate J/gp47 family protein [Xanthobacteraceae bacterium Astr-EGSB]
MFAIPTLRDLTERSRRSFRVNLPGSDAWLWPNNIYASAKVLAGMVFEVFGFADYIYRQRFAGLADGENLDLHGQEYGLARRPAAPAGGYVTLTAAGSVTVDAGARFVRADGVEYRATAPAQLTTAGAIDIEVVAAIDGKAANAEAATPLVIASGVTTDADVLAEVASGGIVGGADVETDGPEWTSDLGTFRGRILFRKRNPPHGGAPADYVMWATSVSGVTRVFVERRWGGPGTVRVFVLMDDLYPDGIPPAPTLAHVDAFIQSEAPAGAYVTVGAPTPRVVDVTISGLYPDTSDVRESVLAELRAAFRRLSRVAGGDVSIASMPFLAAPESFSRSWIWQAVANASGEQRHVIVQPAADVSLHTGELPVLGTVTFLA